MSLDELRKDLTANVAEASKLTSVEGIRNHLVNTMWPFQEAVLNELEEIDDAVAEMVDQTEDYLQPETAAIFASLVESSVGLAQELRAKTTDDITLKRIAEHEKLCQLAMTTLGEITMVAPADGDDDDGDEPEGDPS